jgi:hypothetical protein
LETWVEKRSSLRYTMALPLSIRDGKSRELPAETRDVSFRGLYFTLDSDVKVGTEIDFVLTLPKQITLATDVHIRCAGQVTRVESLGDRKGVAARIDRYEFLPQT